MRTAIITPAESVHITVLDEGDDNSPDKALITDLAARARHLAHASRLRVRTSISRCRTATMTPPSITALVATTTFPRHSAPTSTYPPPYPTLPLGLDSSRTPNRGDCLASWSQGNDHVRQDVRIRRKLFKEIFNEMGFGPVHDRDRANIYHVASTKMELRDTAWCVTHSD